MASLGIPLGFYYIAVTVSQILIKKLKSNNLSVHKITVKLASNIKKYSLLILEIVFSCSETACYNRGITNQ